MLLIVIKLTVNVTNVIKPSFILLIGFVQNAIKLSVTMTNVIGLHLFMGNVSALLNVIMLNVIVVNVSLERYQINRNMTLHSMTDHCFLSIKMNQTRLVYVCSSWPNIERSKKSFPWPNGLSYENMTIINDATSWSITLEPSLTLLESSISF